jgi:hypothetical protein
LFGIIIIIIHPVGQHTIGVGYVTKILFYVLQPEDGGSMVFEMLVFYHVTTWCYNPEDHDMYGI